MKFVEIYYGSQIKFIEEQIETPFEQVDASPKAASRVTCLMVEALGYEKNGELMNDWDDIEIEVVVDTSEYVHAILMNWSREEIIYYYELMRQVPNEQEINECKVLQSTYESNEEFSIIEDKAMCREPYGELEKMRRTPLPICLMQLKWNKSRNKHYYYLTIGKVKMKLLRSNCKPD